MRRRGVMALLAGAAVLLSGCVLFGSTSESYRYRLTIEIDTPQGLRTGSGVIEANAAFEMGIPQSGMAKRATGEAVAVELPDGRKVYALLDEAARIVPLSFQEQFPQRRLREGEDWWIPVLENIRTIKSCRCSAVVPVPDVVDPPQPSFHPMFVIFTEPGRRSSIVKLDPLAFDKVLGRGFKLRRIIVEITDDPVTTGIQQRDPWIFYTFKKDEYFRSDEIPLGDFKSLFKKDNQG